MSSLDWLTLVLDVVVAVVQNYDSNCFEKDTLTKTKMLHRNRTKGNATFSSSLFNSTQAFHRPLKVFSFIFNNPLQEEVVRDSKGDVMYYRFHFKWFSRLTLITFLAQLFNISGNLLVSHRIVRGEYQVQRMFDALGS